MSNQHKQAGQPVEAADHIDPEVYQKHPTLAERTVSREVVYQGKFLQIRKDVASLPDGKTNTREFVVHPGAAAMVPIDSEERILVERQFRYGPGRVYIELPAGKIDPGESSFETAKRELIEETGYQAAKWAYLTTIHPAIGFSNEVMDIYLARDLQRVDRNLDEGEFVEIEWVTLGWLVDELRAHRLLDVKTQLAVHWLQMFYEGKLPWPEFNLR